MPRSYSPEDQLGSSSKPKRTAACLNCRRQKLKCDGSQDKPCTRCRTDGVECVVRPRVNAAIVADDLRWQQSVEMRLQTLQGEIADVKAANANLVRQLGRPGPGGFTPIPIKRPPAPPMGGESSLPEHLVPLREILYPAFQDLQEPRPLDVCLDDATVLWESFYDSLAIFHGFTASTDLATPSPLLFSAVVTASANRFAGRLHMRTPVDRWEELFQRALVRLLYVTVPKTWDDSVGLGIARTWFWKADEITAGLLYGSFVETQSPNQNDFRNRRVWDFLEMTTVSHGILHLSTPIVPQEPPRGVPDRRPSHLLLMALNELFDSLGVVNRALINARSLVQTSLTGHAGVNPLSFAEVVVLRTCRSDLERWCPKWVYEIQNADSTKLPTGSPRDFLVGVVSLYFHVAKLVTDGYLNQSPQPETAQFERSARELLTLVCGKWAESLHLFPKLFLHSSLLAAIALPPDDPLVRRAHDLFTGIRNVLHGSGDKLLRRLNDQVAQTTHQSKNPVPAFTPVSGDIEIPMAMAYTGSDSFWADLSGVLGLPQEAVIPMQVEAPVDSEGRPWPRDLGWDSGLRLDRQLPQPPP